MSKSNKPAAKAARDNRANQLNPNHAAYHRSRGTAPAAAQQQASHSKPALDNHANQLNPNSATYRSSRSGCSADGSDSSGSSK